MKRLSLFFAALFVAVSMFAQGEIVGPVAGNLTGGTPVLNTGITGSAINRGGFALKSDGVYFCNGSTGFMYKADLALAGIAAETDSIGKGYYMDIDDGGNVVIYEWTGGSGTLDIAQVYAPNYTLIRRDSLALLQDHPETSQNGRCDMPTCVGNLVTGRAAYFTASNYCSSMLRYNVVDGVMTSVDTIPVNMTLAGNNSVAPLDVDHFYVQSRGNGLLYIDCSGATPVVTPVNPTMFGVNTFTSAYGGKAFQLGGRTLYVMGTYKVGGYLGSFAVFDLTDPANPYVVCEETSTMGTSVMGTACVTFRVSVNNDVATIYEYACFSVRKYTMTLAPACFIKQGNEGAAWQQMAANGDVCSLQGQFLADSLYINTKADDEGAVKYTRANMTFNGTVALRDTVRFNYNPATQAVSIDSLGQFIPTLTFNVKVPAGTVNCYIAGNFNNWSFSGMNAASDSTFTYTYRGFEVDNVAAVEYKYTCGRDWKYVEKGASGEEIGNRHWAESDVVASWASVPVVNVITYELNGGVTNDYDWNSPADMFATFMGETGATGYSTLDEYKALSEKLAAPSGICVKLNNPETAFANDAKWGWLKAYIMKVHAAQADEGASALPDNGAGSAWRYAIGAFFIDGQRETWPKSANFATCGVSTLAAYQAMWKGAYANPSILKEGETWTLTTPYKEGYTFDGWYADSTFTGAKVLSINDSTPTCTLYAKWIEYIPTIEEALAADSAATVKLGGVVTFIRGTKNVYVQDATGGVLLYTKSNATCQVGDFVVVTGNNIMYGGAPELGSAEILRAEAGHDMPGEITTTIATLVANPLKYFCQRVKVEGVNIAKYDSKGNVFVTDGVDTVQCYYVTPDQAAFPVGAKVNLHLIAAYFNGFQFVGPNTGIEIASAAGVDPYQYPALGENSEYTLTNKWLYSTVMDNFSDNAPSPADFARGMVAKDGKMYFINRSIGGFTVVDGATGTMLDPIMITGDHLFEAQDSTGAWGSCVTLPFNDVKLDNAGHFLIGACVSSKNRVQIYTVDITTGAATELINERLIDNEEWGQQLDTASVKWRFDAFNVYGDVTGKAIVMAADANSFYAYKWTIEGGVAGKAERINCTPDPAFDESLLIKDGALNVGDFGTAPQIFPVDFNFFYVDGWNTLPMLYDMDGNLAEDFIDCPTGVNIPMAGDTCTMNTGHNGLCEFQIGDEYFLVMAATNTVGTPTSAFAIYKFADASKSFEGLQPMWFFPKAGMGSLTNGCRTAVPSVEVDGTKATIYVYTNNNGYGVYEMTGLPSGLNNVNDEVNAVKIIENGQVYIIRNGVRYTVLGAQVK